LTVHSMQYMIILFILFLVQFALACACLALSSHQQRRVLRLGWSRASSELKFQMQIHFSCCGFDNSTVNLPADDSGNMGHPPCQEVRHCNSYAFCFFLQNCMQSNLLNFALSLYSEVKCYSAITRLAFSMFSCVEQ